MSENDDEHYKCVVRFITLGFKYGPILSECVIKECLIVDSEGLSAHTNTSWLAASSVLK